MVLPDHVYRWIGLHGRYIYYEGQYEILYAYLSATQILYLFFTYLAGLGTIAKYVRGSGFVPFLFCIFHILLSFYFATVDCVPQHIPLFFSLAFSEILYFRLYGCLLYSIAV